MPHKIELGSLAVLFSKIVKKNLKMKSPPLVDDIRHRKRMNRKQKRAESMFKYSTGQKLGTIMVDMKTIPKILTTVRESKCFN